MEFFARSQRKLACPRRKSCGECNKAWCLVNQAFKSFLNILGRFLPTFTAKVFHHEGSVLGNTMEVRMITKISHQFVIRLKNNAAKRLSDRVKFIGYCSTKKRKSIKWAAWLTSQEEVISSLPIYSRPFLCRRRLSKKLMLTAQPNQIIKPQRLGILVLAFVVSLALIRWVRWQKSVSRRWHRLCLTW